MYIRYKVLDGKVIYKGDKKPLNKEDGTCAVAECETIPSTTGYLTVTNIRECTRVIKDSWTEQEHSINQETGEEITTDVVHPAETETYYACDLIVHNKTQEQLTAEANAKRIPEIKKQLAKLSEDIIQEVVGEVVPNISEKKAQFITLHNELRVLEGKEPRAIVEQN